MYFTRGLSSVRRVKVMLYTDAMQCYGPGCRNNQVAASHWYSIVAAAAERGSSRRHLPSRGMASRLVSCCRLCNMIWLSLSSVCACVWARVNRSCPVQCSLCHYKSRRMRATPSISAVFQTTVTHYGAVAQ